jgi:hypothetical protein
VGVVIWDIARNLYVYGVTADAIGLPLLRGAAGDSEMMTFEFATNLARGTYVIEINVFDPSKQAMLGVLKPAAQFTVVENVTYDGIANLFLEGQHVKSKEFV